MGNQIEQRYELFNDLSVFNNTGLIPTDNSFLRNKIIGLAEKSKNPRWVHIMRLGVDFNSLSYEELLAIEDSLMERIPLSIYKLKRMFNIELMCPMCQGELDNSHRWNKVCTKCGRSFDFSNNKK